MSHLIVSLAWCCGQVFVVAAIATMLSRLVMRRSPGSAAAIALSGVLTAIGLTLIVPIRIPASIHGIADLSRWFDNQGENSGQEGAELAVNAGQGTSRTIAPEHEPEAGARFALGLPLMKRVAESLRRGETVVLQQRRAVAIGAGVLAIGSLFCVGRLLWGVRAIARINGASHVVSDDSIRDAFNELQPCFSGCHVPQVKETDQLAHAAVVGCWRQAIILSYQRREWSPDELKAVLAHEWAHIVRHDFASRIVASLCVALQWFQPLAHGLRRQLLLTQELAADELAAEAIGSRGEYLRALRNSLFGKTVGQLAARRKCSCRFFQAFS